VEMNLADILGNNQYFVGLKGKQIIYSDDFHAAMYQKIRDAGMTYVEAYNALGFNTELLGVGRANCAGQRAMAAAKTGALFQVDPAKYDGSKALDWDQLSGMSVYEQNASMTARLRYLEELLEMLKYVPVMIGGEAYSLKSRIQNVDQFELVDRFIARMVEDGRYTIQQCLAMFGVNSDSYYTWKSRRDARAEAKAAEDDEERRIMEAIRQICRKLGYNPGKRQMQVYLKRDHGISIGLRRIKRIMNRMRIQPTLPKKDAYKNQVTYNHPMASPDNKLMRNFYIGPRKVVLTDITYIYYGAMRTLLYLCVFYDPFTREVLGYAVDSRMTVGLVKRAYARMMEEHGAELKNPGVYLHSDQGSQYLETSFSQLLTDDGFIRSVSRRGNSQDNAPMESFFGRMKSHIMDILALCPDMETAIRLVEGYMDAYNNENYQYTLAGLTPAEFYFYSMTGVYPCDEYYGVGREELLSVKELIAARRRAADFKAAKRRESYARQKATPQGIVERDLLKIEKRLRSLTALKEDTEEEISLLETLQSKMKEAITFLENAADDVIRGLMESHENWERYPQLGYIYEMDGMF